MSKNIHSEKDSFGSRPNKNNKNNEWVEESFGVDLPSQRVRKKPSKKINKKK